MGWLDFLFPTKLAEAELVVVHPDGGGRIPIQFIPRTYELTERNVYAESAIPGLPGAPIQFVRGQPKLLSMVLYFDTRQSGTDVRQAMSDISDLMNVLHETHAPPVLRFVWKAFELTCVLESRVEEIHSLFADGRPSRATMQATFKEFTTVDQMRHGADG
jgi:hypothetical protein